jgi:hypothetical protein
LLLEEEDSDFEEDDSDFDPDFPLSEASLDELVL